MYSVVCLRNEVEAAAQPVMEERAELLDHQWVDMEKAEQLREKLDKRAALLCFLCVVLQHWTSYSGRSALYSC